MLTEARLTSIMRILKCDEADLFPYERIFRERVIRFLKGETSDFLEVFGGGYAPQPEPGPKPAQPVAVSRDDQLGAEGRIKLDASICHGAPDGWFKPGAGKSEWFKDHELGPEMVVVSAGEFTMGSSPSQITALNKEYNLYDREGPQRIVRIKRPFAVGRFAITRGQFDAFARATGHKTESGLSIWKDSFWTGGKWKDDPVASWRTPGFSQDDNHPVVGINWDDAKAYVTWLVQTAAVEAHY